MNTVFARSLHCARRVVFAVLLVGTPLLALEFPALSGRVVDTANVISSGAESTLTGNLRALEEQSGVQCVVVTVPSLQGADIGDFGYQLGREWGIGNKDTDSGVLLILAPSERQVRIEVGYGNEGDLTDAAAKLIIENVITPRLREGDFDAAMLMGVTAISAQITGEELKTPPPRQQNRSDRRNPAFAFSWVFPLIIFLIFSGIGRRGRGGGILSGILLGSVISGLAGRSSGGFSSGGFGGGGFSGGGGSFGGGGASGSW